MLRADSFRTEEASMVAASVAATSRPISDTELDQVSGGFFPFIATGVALGILYCMADGTLDPQPGPKGDFPTGPKNVG
jgi:hypothetical protein